MKTFKNFINEGVDDPGIFKAVFLAGGPGSGKSFVVNRLLPRSLSGMKLVNSDEVLEFLLKKNGIPSDMMKMSPEELIAFSATREKAKRLIAKKEKLFVDGRLGMVIDGTGRSFAKISKKRSDLRVFGYDTFMVFVNTSLDVALERNQMRARTVDEKIVIKAWNDVQTNLGRFQKLFGTSNIIIIDNNRADEDVLNSSFKEVQKFVKKPIQSRLAKSWIKQKRSGESIIKRD